MRSGRYLKNNPQPTCHNAADAVAQALAYLRPPERLSVSAWADRHRIMGGSSPFKGPWQTSRTPFLREIMDSLSPDSPWQMVVFAKCAQIGGSETLLNLLGYFMENAPCPVMLIQPTVEMAKRLSKQRLDPMIESTAALKGLVKDKRSRDSGNTVLMKSFRGGVLVITGANSAVGLRSMPCKVVLADEIDAYPPSASNEGDPLSLAIKRTVAFGSQRKIFALSTPTLEETSRVAKLYEESDRRKFFVPCPACGTFQTLRWEQLDLDTGEYVCEGCEARIENRQKADVLPRGEWRPTADRPSDIRGYHLNALYAPVGWPTWPELAVEYRKAQRSKETLQVFHNTVLAETWRDGASTPLDADLLYSRREPWSGEIPAGACLLTCGADVQSNRLELELVAWGAGEENWSILYAVLQGDPTQGHVWRELDRILLRQYRHASGFPISVSACCIDSGYASSEVYAFTRDKASRRIWATKGASNSFQRPIFPRRSSKGKDRSPFFLVATDAAKERAYSQLRVSEPGPKYCHFPLDRAHDYFMMLTSERIVTRYKAGFPHRQWTKPPNVRNEALDARALAICALFGLFAHGVRLDDYAANFENMLKPHSDQKLVQPTKVYSRFVWG